MKKDFTRKYNLISKLESTLELLRKKKIKFKTPDISRLTTKEITGVIGEYKKLIPKKNLKKVDSAFLSINGQKIEPVLSHKIKV